MNGRSVGRFAKWLARKTPLRKPNRGEGFFSTKPTPKSVYDFLDGWCVRSLLFPAIRGVLKKWTWLQAWVKMFDRLWNWLTKVFYRPTDLPPASLKLRPYKFDYYYYYYISVRCYLYGVFKKRPCSAVTVASKPKKCRKIFVTVVAVTLFLDGWCVSSFLWFFLLLLFYYYFLFLYFCY